MEFYHICNVMIKKIVSLKESPNLFESRKSAQLNTYKFPDTSDIIQNLQNDINKLSTSDPTSFQPSDGDNTRISELTDC